MYHWCEHHDPPDIMWSDNGKNIANPVLQMVEELNLGICGVQITAGNAQGNGAIERKNGVGCDRRCRSDDEGSRDD